MKGIDIARAYWEQYGLPMTAGTDNHHLSAERISGITTEQPLMTPQDYVTAVKSGRVGLIIA